MNKHKCTKYDVDFISSCAAGDGTEVWIEGICRVCGTTCVWIMELEDYEKEQKRMYQEDVLP